MYLPVNPLSFYLCSAVSRLYRYIYEYSTSFELSKPSVKINLTEKYPRYLELGSFNLPPHPPFSKNPRNGAGEGETGVDGVEMLVMLQNIAPLKIAAGWGQRSNSSWYL